MENKAFKRCASFYQNTLFTNLILDCGVRKRRRT
jgi:hypothetical protein